MRKVSIILVIGMLLNSIGVQNLFAGEIDILMDKLVEKGVFTPLEAQIILDETRQEAAKELAEGKSYAVPKWTQKIKFKGDLRTRYQWEKRKGSKTRNRERIRFRLGSEMKVADGVKVAAGLATGGADPRSTNQTLDNTFATKGINLDYAYGQYSPAAWLTLKGGKIKKMPFWVPTDFLWDSDINPEGLAAGLKWTKSPYMEFFFNTGVFSLDESSSDTSDPFMYTIQPGFDWKMNEDTRWKAAAAFYGFDNLKGAVLDHSAETNTLSNGVLRYNYNSIGLSSELVLENVLGFDLPRIALLGEYINSFDPEENEMGFLLGFKVGDKKVKKKDQWQAYYRYSRLERDAFPDTFPDSDFYSGQTNVKGHEAIFQYGLLKNVILGLDYYGTEPIQGTRNSEHLFQTDLVFKF